MSKKTSAASGLMYMTFSKVIFLLTGYAIYLCLARILGPEVFGIYGVVVGIVSVINMVLITGTMQSISKFVSERPSLALDVKTQGLKMQSIFGVSISFCYFLSAGLIASLLKDASLIPYLRLSSLIPLFYSFYGVFMGYVNGLKSFRKQALFDITFSSMKCFFILLFAWLGFSAMGAVFGFALSAGLILSLSILLIGINIIPSPNVSLKKLFLFGITISIFTASANLLISLDLFLVKAFTAKDTAGLSAGYYTAAQTIARIPFFLIAPLNLVLFPIISQSTSAMRKLKTKYYINSGLRYMLAVMTLMAALISSSSREIISFLYSKVYEPASAPLSLLSIGMLIYSLMMTLCTIISASGKPRRSLAIIAATLCVSFAAGYLLIPRYNLAGAALATSIAALTGLIISAGYIINRFRSFIRGSSLLRIFISGASIYIIGRLFYAGGLRLILKLSFLGLIYIAMLLLLKEIGKKDLRKLKSLFAKSKA